MGAVIEGLRSTRPKNGHCQPSSIDLASRAAERALETAGCPPDDVGLLINTGVYRDENICEPAISPFIQREIRANHRLRPGADKQTLSFDISNGACGFLTGIQLVDGFLASGKIQRGMVVTSDVDPTPEVSDGWSFDAVGAAVLLRSGAPGEGFVAFHSETFGKYSHLFEAKILWRSSDRSPNSEQTHALRIRQSPHYAAACAQCAAKAIGCFLDGRGLALGELDLIVPSQTPEGFAEALAEKLGPAGEHGPAVWTSRHRAHTAGVAVALEAAMHDPRYRSARSVLLVAIGSGISVSLALYLKPPSDGTTILPEPK